MGNRPSRIGSTDEKMEKSKPRKFLRTPTMKFNMSMPMPKMMKGQDSPGKRDIYRSPSERLEAALSMMAGHMQSHMENLILVTTGEAVTTLLLKSSQPTSNIDLFGANLSKAQQALLSESIQFVEDQDHIVLPPGWIQNHTKLWMPPKIQAQILQEATEQNEIVFQKLGLTVLAAPWKYALCDKMNRLQLLDIDSQVDLWDAARYLHYHIESTTRRPVTKLAIKRWCQDYQKQTSNEVIDAVNTCYVQFYKKPGMTQ